MKVDTIDKLKQMVRMDGWSNILTGLGLGSKDKRTGGSVSFVPMNEFDAESLFAGDTMAQKIVKMLPRDMVREGFRITSPDIDEKLLEQAMDYFERLTLSINGDKMCEGMEWGRMYGGSALIVGTDDEDTEEPLSLESLREVTHFTLMSRFELIAQDICVDPSDANFSYPDTYMIQPRVSGKTPGKLSGGIKIHHSRIIRFDGVKLPRNAFMQNQYWNDSILNNLQAAIRDFQASYDSAHALILDFAQAVYKVKNLADIVGSPDGQKKIQDRIAIIELTRSVLRAAIVDADGEDFERKTTSMQGLDKVLDAISRKFTSSTEYPHTILLGEAPSGLGATGESEKNDYYDLVLREQKQVLKPKLKRIFEIIFSAGDGPTNGKIPEKWDLEFAPLKHLNKKETIEARKTQAETDKIYIEAGVVDSDEVGLSRFGSGEYNFETEINAKLRDTSQRDESDDEGAEPESTVRADSLHKSRYFKGDMKI